VLKDNKPADYVMAFLNDLPIWHAEHLVYDQKPTVVQISRFWFCFWHDCKFNVRTNDIYFDL